MLLTFIAFVEDTGITLLSLFMLAMDASVYLGFVLQGLAMHHFGSHTYTSRRLTDGALSHHGSFCTSKMDEYRPNILPLIGGFNCIKNISDADGHPFHSCFHTTTVAAMCSVIAKIQPPRRQHSLLGLALDCDFPRAELKVFLITDYFHWLLTLFQTPTLKLRTDQLTSCMIHPSSSSGG